MQALLEAYGKGTDPEGDPGLLGIQTLARLYSPTDRGTPPKSAHTLHYTPTEDPDALTYLYASLATR